ncbi:MAG: 50S ribosomal protein L13 [Pseudomonadota bacterium]
MNNQKTTLVTPANVTRGWVIVDVQNQVVGRVASTIADILRGKNKPSFTPNIDNGDFVVVINASKVKFTGKKAKQKEYHRHTGFFGGLKSITVEKQLQKHPERVLEDAVWGMLPKNRLSKKLIKKLKIYSGTEHPHEAQNPVELKIEKAL